MSLHGDKPTAEFSPKEVIAGLRRQRIALRAERRVLLSIAATTGVDKMVLRILIDGAIASALAAYDRVPTEEDVFAAKMGTEYEGGI